MKAKKYPKLRSVKVTYSNGMVNDTSMAAHLSNKEIRDYFKVGRVFNVGTVGDKLVKVKKVKIKNKTNNKWS